VFGARAFTPFVPLCPSPQTEKQNRILFKSNLLSQIKGKHVHHITQRMRFGLSPKALSHIFAPVGRKNIAYAGTLSEINNFFNFSLIEFWAFYS